MLRELYLPARFFYALTALIAVVILSYVFPVLLFVAQIGGLILVVVTVTDLLLLFRKSVNLEVSRETQGVLSLGDFNDILIRLTSKSPITLSVDLVDEIPEQFQQRDFSITFEIKPGEDRELKYPLRPVSRGEYHFGSTHTFVSTTIGLVRRRITFPLDTMIPVYPSIIQMRKYELRTFARIANEYGVKKVRRIGHSYEFEHIKPYIHGDDYRSINWKATGRRAQLMVNQYEDEKSQQVYCLIDKSRVMHMPFNGLSLFDYAVNAALVISNIVLAKQDKIGLITFGHQDLHIRRIGSLELIDFDGGAFVGDVDAETCVVFKAAAVDYAETGGALIILFVSMILCGKHNFISIVAFHCHTADVDFKPA